MAEQKRAKPHSSLHNPSYPSLYENRWKIAILCKALSAPDDAYFLAELLQWEREGFPRISANYCRKISTWAEENTHRKWKTSNCIFYYVDITNRFAVVNALGTETTKISLNL